MNNIFKILSELIESSSEANKLLISNTIAMENADIDKAQKTLKEATSLLSTMIKDIFIEVREVVSSDTEIEEEYDFSVLDIAKLLSKICYNAGSLINCYVENYPESIRLSVETKLLKCINATKSLTLSILLN